MEFLLFIIAWSLKVALSPLLFIWGIIRAIYRKEVLSYFKQLAVATDALGNVLGQYAFNDTLKKKPGYNFGNRKDTVSYVLAINFRLKKLSKFGEFVSKCLNLLEPNHLEKAITELK